MGNEGSWFKSTKSIAFDLRLRYNLSIHSHKKFDRVYLEDGRNLVNRNLCSLINYVKTLRRECANNGCWNFEKVRQIRDLIKKKKKKQERKVRYKQRGMYFENGKSIKRWFRLKAKIQSQDRFPWKDSMDWTTKESETSLINLAISRGGNVGNVEYNIRILCKKFEGGWKGGSRSDAESKVK